MILKNAMITPDGTEIRSMHRHDYVLHVDSTNGKTYFVDGGTEYLRRSSNGDAIDSSVLVDESDYAEEIVRENLVWGTYGKDGRSELRWVALKDMDSDHIESVLNGCNLSKFYRNAMEHELKLRHEKQG